MINLSVSRELCEKLCNEFKQAAFFAAGLAPAAFTAACVSDDKKIVALAAALTFPLAPGLSLLIGDLYGSDDEKLEHLALRNAAFSAGMGYAIAQGFETLSRLNLG